MIKIFRWMDVMLEGGMDKYGNTTDTGFSPHESILTRRESIQHFKTKFMAHSTLTTQHRFHSIEKKENLKKIIDIFKVSIFYTYICLLMRIISYLKYSIWHYEREGQKRN